MPIKAEKRNPHKSEFTEDQPKKEGKMVFSMAGARTAWPKAGVISAVMRQAVMGHERLFCSAARPLDLWIPPTSSAPESDHYALDGGDMTGGTKKLVHKMLVKKSEDAHVAMPIEK